MEDNKYPRGSEWRKWDLHVHTKSSYDYKYDGDNPDDKLIETLRANKISVVAITDHFVIDKDTISGLKSKAPDIIFFPGVELRTDKGGANIHPIIIFDEKSNLDELCEDFNTFKRNESKNHDDNDKIYWDYEKIIEFSKKHNGVISIHAGSKKNGIDEQISNYLPVKVAIKEEYADSVCIYEVGKLEDIEEYKKYVFPKIGERPLIVGSDNHKPTKYPNEHNSTIFTWIKADPTFEGLKQIINEPDRVYIGENKPQLLERIENYPTKFIKQISISKKADSSIDEIWYGSDTKIDINPGLTTIIGNKGSGKSAITDIISLCANTHNSDFSFLRKEKFRNPKPYNRAKNHEAQLTWYDDSISSAISLEENGKDTQPERVKYIPQNFLENLCTTEDDKEFEKEMKSIIFQHIPQEGRYEKKSLDEIIDYLSSEVIDSEKEIKLKISEQNKVIIDLEDKQRTEYKEHIENSKALKEEELNNLQKAKPDEVSKPNHVNSEEEKKKQEAIDSLRVQLKDIESEITTVQDELTVLNKQIQDLSSAKEKLERLNDLVKKTIGDIKNIFDETKLKISEIIRFSINVDEVQNKIDSLKSEQAEKRLYLEDEGEKSLKLKKTTIEKQIQEAEKELSEPDRLYHKYVEDLKSWQEKVDAIKGNADAIDTIEYYKSQLKYVEEQLGRDISEAYEKRKCLVLELLSKKRNELNIRSELYQPVSSFIESNSDLENYSMTLDATFIFNGIENFFDYINQRNSGTFCGKEQGMVKMKELQEDVSLAEDDSIYNFAWTLNKALFYDFRNNNSSCDIKTQIKDSHNQLELYDFIYSLDYIEPLFQLKLDDKPLSALSPGERGALLLLFYLFIDMDDKPLIIDQPEENLDNESVYKYLVKFIKQAKEKRQIIMVTHNPNLAVVCDADQVIKMDIDKKNKNTVSFMSGSIENPDMNKCIVNVLEGTYPAFHNRDSKYFDKSIS